MKAFCVLSLAFLLVACPKDPNRVVSNPSIEDVIGSWESSGFTDYVPYALVEIDANGNGAVVLAKGDDAGVFFEIQNIRFEKSDIFMDMISSLEEEGQEEQEDEGTIVSSIIYGQLCVTEFVGEEDYLDGKPIWCFTKSDELEKYQKISRKTLDAYKQNKMN